MVPSLADPWREAQSSAKRRNRQVTGASGCNRVGCDGEAQLPERFSAINSALLTDPPTSGGLPVSCDADAVAEVLAVFHRHGIDPAAEIGEIVGAAASERACGCAERRHDAAIRAGCPPGNRAASWNKGFAR